jgi:LPXTG-motif cell wall-anchored protein
MKLVINIVAVLLILTGIVWFLQGINVLPGSFMTGQIGWAIAGVGAAIVGGGLLVFTNRRRGDPPPTGSG